MKNKRKNILKKIGITLLVLVILGFVSTLILEYVYGRSIQATLIEFYFSVGVNKNVTKEEAEIELQKQAKINDIPYELPDIEMKGGIKEKKWKGMQTFYLNENGKGPTILFLHGGAYVSQPSVYHWYFLNKLVDKKDVRVILPIYPKAPNHNYKETYDLITSLYESLPDKEDLIFMGDSSGGGLATGLSQYFNEKGISQPKKLILISAWIDIAMENEEIPKYEKVDPLLRRTMLLPSAESWAGGTDLDHYQLSPINGKMKGLPETVIFVGTREICYPDNLIFYNLLNENGVKTKLFIGNGMNHAYPLIPIPEADEALLEIVDLL